MPVMIASWKCLGIGLVSILTAVVLSSCATLFQAAAAPQQTAAAIVATGTQSLTGAPVGEVMQARDSLSSIDRALAQAPNGGDTEELQALRQHFEERAAAESGTRPQGHIDDRFHDRLERYDERPSGMTATFDAEGRLTGYKLHDRQERQFMVALEPPPAQKAESARDPWRFTMPRRYQLKREVSPPRRSRLLMGGQGGGYPSPLLEVRERQAMVP